MDKGISLDFFSESLLELSFLNVVVFNSSNEIVYASRALKLLTGFESDEIDSMFLPDNPIKHDFYNNASEIKFIKKDNTYFLAKTENKSFSIKGKEYTLMAFYAIKEVEENKVNILNQTTFLQDSINLTDTLYKLERGFIAGDAIDKQHIYSAYLKAILEYTKSEVGLIGEVKNSVCNVYAVLALNDTNSLDALISEIIETEKPVILDGKINKYENTPYSYLGLPIIKGKEVIGIIIVSSSIQGKYTEITLKRLVPFVSSLMSIIDYNRAEFLQMRQLEILSKNEYRLKKIFENLNTPILILDPDTCDIRYVNNNMVNTIAYSEKELLTMNIADIEASRDFENIKISLKKTLEQKQTGGSTTWVTKNGEIRDVLLKSSLIEIYEKPCILLACYDITLQKKLLKELSDKQLISDSVISSMNSGVIIWNKNGVILEGNKFAVKAFGSINPNFNNLKNVNLKYINFYDEINQPKRLEELAVYKTFLNDENVESEIIKVLTTEKEEKLYDISSWCIKGSVPEENLYVAKFIEVTEQKKSQLALKHSEERFKELFENVPLGIFTSDINGFITSSNSVCAKMFGYSKDELLGMKIENLIANKYSKNKHQSLVDGYFIKPESKKMLSSARVVYGVKRNGEQIPVEVSLSYFITDNIPQAIAIVSDFSEREEAFNTKKMLDERETLLKEIHHRVKNNMQIISSLLSLQSAKIKDVESLAQFKESESRIKSMALIHEKLYESDSLSEINLAEYLNDLTTYLFGSYLLATPIKVKKELSIVTLNIEQCIPCGLIVNEFITNALKYAFVGRNEGELKVFLKEKNNEITVVVSDNGIGITEFYDKKNTLGLRLIKSLTKQLGGKLTLTNNNGLTCELVFEKKKNNSLEWES